MVRVLNSALKRDNLNPLLFNAVLKLPWTSVLLKLMVANFNLCSIVSVVLYSLLFFVQRNLRLLQRCDASSYLSVSSACNFYFDILCSWKINLILGFFSVQFFNSIIKNMCYIILFCFNFYLTIYLTRNHKVCQNTIESCYLSSCVIKLSFVNVTT